MKNALFLSSKSSFCCQEDTQFFVVKKTIKILAFSRIKESGENEMIVILLIWLHKLANAIIGIIQKHFVSNQQNCSGGRF